MRSGGFPVVPGFFTLLFPIFFTPSFPVSPPAIPDFLHPVIPDFLRPVIPDFLRPVIPAKAGIHSVANVYRGSGFAPLGARASRPQSALGRAAPHSSLLP